jgi:hypothetical protein
METIRVTKLTMLPTTRSHDDPESDHLRALPIGAYREA